MMGELQSKQGGYYILTVNFGAVTLEKTFKDADIPLEDVRALPSTDDFCLKIPENLYSQIDKTTDKTTDKG